MSSPLVTGQLMCVCKHFITELAIVYLWERLRLTHTQFDIAVSQLGWYSTFSCVFMCFLRSNLRMNRNPHVRHSCFFPSSCSRLCLLNSYGSAVLQYQSNTNRELWRQVVGRWWCDNVRMNDLPPITHVTTQILLLMDKLVSF